MLTVQCQSLPAMERPAASLARSLTGRDYLSFSQVSCFGECSLRFFYRYVEEARPDFLAASLLFGTAIHAAIESYFQGRLEGLTFRLRKLMAAYRQAWKSRVHNEQDVPVRFGAGQDQDSANELAGRVLSAFLDSPVAAMDAEVIATEQELRATVDPSLPDVLARIDLIVRQQGSLRIIDFKTSRSSWSASKAAEASPQLRLYQRLAVPMARSLGASLASPQFVVLTKGKRPLVQSIDAAVGERDDDAAVALRSAWSEMKRGNFPATPSFRCTCCEFRSRCPAARSA